MISQLRGQILEISQRQAVIDVGGVGYKVYIIDEDQGKLKEGQDLTVYTHHVVREDAQDLYGFLKKSERDFFRLLITISGIGPKTALNILSLVPSQALVNAVRTGSTAHLVKVSGIGRKTAEKMVLELRDKLGHIGDTEDGTSSNISSDSDVIEALKALGYDAHDARDALKKVMKDIGDKEMDTGSKVKAALKVLS